MNAYRKFFNPDNPGITRTQSWDFGIGKIGRDSEIQDPRIAIPNSNAHINQMLPQIIHILLFV